MEQILQRPKNRILFPYPVYRVYVDYAMPDLAELKRIMTGGVEYVLAASMQPREAYRQVSREPREIEFVQYNLDDRHFKKVEGALREAELRPPLFEEALAICLTRRAEHPYPIPAFASVAEMQPGMPHFAVLSVNEKGPTVTIRHLSWISETDQPVLGVREIA